MQVIHYKVFYIRQILLYQLLQRILYQLYVAAHTIVMSIICSPLHPNLLPFGCLNYQRTQSFQYNLGAFLGKFHEFWCDIFLM